MEKDLREFLDNNERYLQQVKTGFGSNEYTQYDNDFIIAPLGGRFNNYQGEVHDNNSFLLNTVVILGYSAGTNLAGAMTSWFHPTASVMNNTNTGKLIIGVLTNIYISGNLLYGEAYIGSNGIDIRKATLANYNTGIGSILGVDYNGMLKTDGGNEHETTGDEKIKCMPCLKKGGSVSYEVNFIPGLCFVKIIRNSGEESRYVGEFAIVLSTPGLYKCVNNGINADSQDISPAGVAYIGTTFINVDALLDIPANHIVWAETSYDGGVVVVLKHGSENPVDFPGISSYLIGTTNSPITQSLNGSLDLRWLLL